MSSTTPSTVPPGWVGGFAESNPAFAYPNPDLSSLPLLDNMDNIDKLQRQQGVQWPEFSWQTVQGDESSRCFQEFAHEISRLGYDDTGRVWSIICPQQGITDPSIGSINVEVTVSGQRGWADETNRELAADMTVIGKIWFSPSAHENWLVRRAWDFFADESLPFPSDKANAIQVTTHAQGNPDQPLFPVRDGVSPAFAVPAFANHNETAWTVGNLEVQIGPIQRIGHPAVDTFNQKILDIFNQGSGNMLQEGNVLTWNLWFEAPSLVDQEEWRTHAERWRESIDADHGPKSGPQRYADGSEFKPAVSTAKEFEDFLELLWDLV